MSRIIVGQRSVVDLKGALTEILIMESVCLFFFINSTCGVFELKSTNEYKYWPAICVYYCFRHKLQKIIIIKNELDLKQDSRPSALISSYLFLND